MRKEEEKKTLTMKFFTEILRGNHKRESLEPLLSSIELDEKKEEILKELMQEEEKRDKSVNESIADLKTKIGIRLL